MGTVYGGGGRNKVGNVVKRLGKKDWGLGFVGGNFPSGEGDRDCGGSMEG